MAESLDDDLGGNKENRADLGNKEPRMSTQPPDLSDPVNDVPQQGTTDKLLPSSSPGYQNLKAKRSTLFFPSPNFQMKSNQKPFSSSAAKRESVMALGSIGHLQSFYARQGFAAPEPPTAKGAGRLALGPAALANLSHSHNGSAELAAAGDEHRARGTPLDALAALEGRHLLGQSQQPNTQPVSATTEEMPQSTWKGRLPPDIPKPVEADLSRLWDGMIQALDETCQMWDLLGQIKVTPLARTAKAMASNGGSEDIGRPSLDVWSDSLGDADDGHVRRSSHISVTSRMSTSYEPVDVLQLINSTTITVRSVRNYLFALPPAPSPPRRTEEETTTTTTAGKTLRKKPSTQFGEEHIPGVKPKDAFKRQSSFHGLPRGGTRRPSSVLGSSGFLAPSGPPGGNHPPSSFVPFEIVSRRTSRDGGEQISPSNLVHGFHQDEQPPPTSDSQRLGQSHIGKGLPSTPTQTSAPSAGTEHKAATDPLAVIRTAALEVLGMLRELEEKARIAKHDAGSEKAEDTLPSHESVKMMRNYSEASASSGTLMQAPAEDVDDEVEGFLYKNDLTLAQLDEEREIVKRYLSTVDGVLSAVTHQRGSSSRAAKEAEKGLAVESLSLQGPRRSAAERRSASESIGPGHTDKDARAPGKQTESGRASYASSVDDEDRLPAWARLDFEGDAIARARALLCEVLPDMADQLSPPGMPGESWREKFLAELSDGQVLCHGYNGALRRSVRPWGFIQSSSVHDVKAEEEGYYEALGDQDKEGMQREAPRPEDGSGATSSPLTRRPGWTFRRAENLKRFCAAIGLRYNVRGATASPAFEAVEVARREGQWERMLETVVAEWVSRVIEEERSC